LIHFYKRTYFGKMSKFDARKKLRDEYVAKDGSMDVQFKVGNEIILAHKSILIGVSDVFKTQFTGPLNSGGDELGMIVLKECSYDSFMNLLNIIYGVEVADSADTGLMFDTLLLAEKYQIDGIVAWLKGQLDSLAEKKETALEVVIAAYAFKHLATFEDLAPKLRTKAAVTLHREMSSFKEAYQLQDKLKDNPGVLNYLMEEMAAVQEENVREKELKNMERERENEIKEMEKEIKDMEREKKKEMKVKDDEINQLQKKLRKYQVRKCRNCLEVEESCKDGQKFTYPQIGLKVNYVGYNRYRDTRWIITEYKTILVDRDGVVTFTATLIATTPACKAGEKKENISSSDLWYACQ